MSSHVMKFVRSSIHLCVTKNVAPKPRSFRSGATKVRCDFTASSKVSTTSLSGTARGGAPNAIRRQNARIATPKKRQLQNGRRVLAMDVPERHGPISPDDGGS